MTREELREQLARLADTAPVASVPEDTYRRGRRAVTRTRIAGAALAAGCVALLAMVGVGVIHRGDTDPGFSSSSGVAVRPAVPDHVYTTGDDLPLSPTLKVGQAAAAYVDVHGRAVVVDAATGDYHRVHLAGLSSEFGTAHGRPAVSLSPDGRFLAWAWVDGAPGAPATTRPTGVRVADLTTGRTVSTSTNVGFDKDQVTRPADVFALAWSPDGRWLGWEARQLKRWTADSYVPSGRYLGETTSIRPGGPLGEVDVQDVPGTSADTVTSGGTARSDSDRPRPIAVRDDGTLVSVAGRTLVTGDNRPGTITSRWPATQTFRLTGGHYLGGLWIDGSRVMAVEYPNGGGSVSIRQLLPSGQSVAVSTSSLTVPRVLGVLPYGQVLLEQDDSRRQYEDATTVWAVSPGPGGRVQQVMTVDPDVVSLSVATDLMQGPQLTVPRQRPACLAPSHSTRTWWLAGGAGALGLAVLVAGGLWWSRQRSAR